MALSPPMNGAYFNGLDQDGGLQRALDNIPGSGTTDYLLCSLNVQSSTSADINYGWNLNCTVAKGGRVTQWTIENLVQVVGIGVSEGKCKRVWLVIGGAGNGPQTDTFTNIQTILNNGGPVKADLLANFGALHKALNINGVTTVGFDMDYEENGDLASAVSGLTYALFKDLGGRNVCPITFCPSFPSTMNDWITALQQIYSKPEHQQPVVGFNLQCYSGGDNNNPPDWTAAVKNAQNTGVTDPDNFVWPILSWSYHDLASPYIPPDQVAAKLKGWGSKGASLWCTLALFTLTDYGKAFSQGIQS